MFKAITPIIGIIIAVGLFFTYVQPTFRDIRGIQDETAQYAQATEKASELQRRISELQQKQKSIPLASLERLSALLPDRVSEVPVLIDVDALATLHHLTLGDIIVGGEEKNESKNKSEARGMQKQSVVATAPGQMPGSATGEVSPQSVASLPGTGPDMLGGDLQSNETTQSQYSWLDIGFSVTGTYDDFRAFLQDVEQSLVLMEVMDITFEISEGDATSFTMSVRLYSLNPPTS